MADRYQFVWWGFAARWRIGKHGYEGGLAHIYDWSISIGPLEIRKWHQRRTTPAKRSWLTRTIARLCARGGGDPGADTHG